MYMVTKQRYQRMRQEYTDRGIVSIYGLDKIEQACNFGRRKVIPCYPQAYLNRTYIPLKVGAIAGYILLGILSATTSIFGILVGAMLCMTGL